MWGKLLTATGLAFIVIGIILILIPLITRYTPLVKLENIPWFILYIYRGNGFLLATSPILIVIAIVYLAITILKHLQHP